MENKVKTLKQLQGAMTLTLSGKNQLTLNWKDNIMEIYHNGQRKFVIDMNKA